MEWISVTEKLPERGGSHTPCLVLCKNEGIVVRPFNHYHNCWDDEDWDDHYSVAVGGSITHWMPLPEPPSK